MVPWLLGKLHRLLHLFGSVLGLIFMGPFCTLALLASLLFNLWILEWDFSV